MKNQRFCRPSLEWLEDRWTPAGTVTGSFAHGTWTLIGDAEANTIRINPGTAPKQFTVTGLNGTTVGGVTDASNVKNIVVRLGAGQDEVNVNTTDAPVQLPGTLKIDGGTGANYVSIDDLAMKNLVVRNGVNASGTDFLYLSDSIVRKDMAVINAGGNSHIHVFRNTSDVSSIGGSLFVRNGVGADTTYIGDTHIGGNVIARNGLHAANGAAGTFEIYNSKNQTSRSIIGGNVLVSYQGGTVEDDGIWDTEVLGNVKFKYGSGSSKLCFDGYTVVQPVHIHGNLTVIGQGNNLVEIGVSNQKTGLIVGKNFTILTGSGSDKINIYRLRVGGATRIVTGAGNDSIAVDDSGFAGPTTILTGGGIDDVFFESAAGTGFGTQFAKALTVDLGADDDILLIGFPGDDTRLVQLLARARLSGGAGTDTLDRFNLASVFGAPIDVLFETIQL